MLRIEDIRSTLKASHAVKPGYPFKNIVHGDDAFLHEYGFIEVDDLNYNENVWTIIFHFHGVDDQFFSIDVQDDSWNNSYNTFNLFEVETYTEPVTKWRKK